MQRAAGRGTPEQRREGVKKWSTNIRL